MPRQITNHNTILEAIRSVTLIDELVDKHNGHFAFELDLEVIAYGRNYTGKKVGPYVSLFLYSGGEVIVQQGEWGGNSFFLLVAGHLDVYVRDPTTDSQNKVGEIQPGRSFGEMSVLAGLPRNATIVVPEGGEARVLEVQRPALRLLRKLPKFGSALESTYREYGLKRTLLDLNQATAGAFSPEIMQRLEQIGQFRVFGKKHVLTYENGLINWVFFIKNGWVRRSKGIGALPYKTSLMMVDQDVGADFLGAGNCLGLEALGGEAKWSYTTTVLARTEVLELPLPQLRADPELAETLMRTFS